MIFKRTWLICILNFLTFSIIAHSQAIIQKVDTFYHSTGYGSVLVLLTGDHNYFIANSNHTTAEIARGKWVAKSNRIYLKPSAFSYNVVSIKTHTYNIIYEKKISITVIDYFNKPMPLYPIVFFDKKGREFPIRTDQNGIILINPNSYSSFMLDDELKTFDYSNNLTDSSHKIDPGLHLIISINYPKSILLDSITIKPIDFRGREYLVTKKGLKNPNSKGIIPRR